MARRKTNLGFNSGELETKLSGEAKTSNEAKTVEATPGVEMGSKVIENTPKPVEVIEGPNAFKFVMYREDPRNHRVSLICRATELTYSIQEDSVISFTLGKGIISKSEAIKWLRPKSLEDLLGLHDLSKVDLEPFTIGFDMGTYNSEELSVVNSMVENKLGSHGRIELLECTPGCISLNGLPGDKLVLTLVTGRARGARFNYESVDELERRASIRDEVESYAKTDFF